MSDIDKDRLNRALTGRYRIERKLGEGGMATVYLTDDVKHERQVALKVLKPELAAVVGGDRFLAEIKTTANLQHPHILPLYDSGEADSFLYYVMPYVQGETLRDRIDREKQLPVEDAVRIAVAVGNALDYAHRHGVVHRDIKPGNILIQDGQPVVGDFGIALAVGSAGGARLTETGLSVGTPFYMSPEQATGDMGVGPASDTYALAAVLYEMLTGEPPYTGTTAQAVLGRIIQGVPVSATAMRTSVPAHVDAAIRKGLEKLPADRFKGAQDFATALQDPAFRHGEARGAAGAAAGAGPWKWVAAAAVVASLGLSAALVSEMTQPEPELSVERFAMPFLPGQELEFTGEAGYKLSPDGQMLVYRYVDDGRQILVARRWDDLRATPIRETEGASNPALSPDGLELAFEQGDEVKVLALAGGPVRTLVSPGFNPVWGRDGYVYARADSGTVRVRAEGGPVEVVTVLSGPDDGHRPYAVLPSDKLIYVAPVDDFNAFEIRGFDPAKGESKLIANGLVPSYLPSGHLLFVVDGVLMAARFDPDDLELLGQPVAVLDGLASYSVSENGKLFYTIGTSLGGTVERLIQLMWVDRAGQARPVDPDWTFVQGGPDIGWSLSPDGTQLAIRERTTDGNDIWIKQLDTGPRSRLTFGPDQERMPVWGPEPGEVTFLSDRDGNLDVWSKAADGTGEPRRLLDFEESVATVEWSPDFQSMLIRTVGPRSVEANRDIYLFRPGVDSVPTPLLADEGYDEMYPDISPDGRWIAYQTTETDRSEIYVRPFPDVRGGRWQVSVNGGRQPRWANSGREIFFQGPNLEMMVVNVDASSGFRASEPRELFQSEPGWIWGDISGLRFEVSADDQSFLIAREAPRPGGEEAEGEPTAVLVNNFHQELKTRLSGGR
ncbi:MAG: protein kinase [Gemmatimonadetes bacterium]|nr:protein kinase [Gemmatimonadota bacterium]NNL30342.1 protein kinase [Gemmatimonadota bacterium]